MILLSDKTGSILFKSCVDYIRAGCVLRLNSKVMKRSSRVINKGSLEVLVYMSRFVSVVLAWFIVILKINYLHY